MRPGVGTGVLVAAALACAARPQATSPAVSPAPSARGPISFTPGTARYRNVSYVRVEQRVGDQTQQSDQAKEYFLTATLARQGEHLKASLTVDSAPRYQTGSPAGFGWERIRGVTLAGDLAADGEIRGLAGGDSTVRALAELAEELSHFYPRILAGGVEPGARWTDTTRTTSKAGGLPLTVVAVSQHEAGAPADSGSQGALPIRTLTTYTFSGQGTQGGQGYSVAGEGRRATVEMLGLNGQFLRMISADTSTFTVSMPALDVSIPGRQTRADTLSILP